MLSNYTFSNSNFFIIFFLIFLKNFLFENQKLSLKLFFKKQNWIFKYLFIYLLES